MVVKWGFGDAEVVKREMKENILKPVHIRTQKSIQI